MRAAVGARASTGSTTLPSGSLYAPANNGLMLVEVGLFNTTTTAAAFKLARLTTAGTASDLTTEVLEDGTGTPIGTAKDTHTVGPTIGGTLRQATLGAAAGAGVIWTGRWWIPNGTANGIGIVCATGTSQIIDWYMVWEE